MSDGISRLYDDYDDYLNLCNKMNASPQTIMSDWYIHQSELEKKEDDEIIARKGKRYYFSKEAKGTKDDFDRPTEYHFKKQLLDKKPKEIYSPNTIYGMEKPYIHSIEFLDEDENIQFIKTDEKIINKMSIEEFRNYLQFKGFKSLFMYF